MDNEDIKMKRELEILKEKKKAQEQLLNSITDLIQKGIAEIDDDIARLEFVLG